MVYGRAMTQDRTFAQAAVDAAGQAASLDGDGPATEPGLRARLLECEAELARMRRDQAAVSYGVAHDLRAPLRQIEGFAAMLDATSGAALDAAGRHQLSRLRAAAADMASLMDALQALSHASHDDLDITEVDASLLADWVLAEMRDAEPGRAVEASVQQGIRVLADERQLKQVFERLLRNAWAFSAGREAVHVEVAAERDGGRVRIRIRDRGCGFDPRQADRIFEPFQRLHAREQGAGHGLGLAIARRLTGRMGGSLRATTVPGEGSVFHVELPAPATGGSLP